MSDLINATVKTLNEMYNIEETEQLDEAHETTVALAKEVASKYKGITSSVSRGNVQIHPKVGKDGEVTDRLMLSHTGKDKDGNNRFHLHRISSSGEDSDHRNLTAAEVHQHAKKHM